MLRYLLEYTNSNVCKICRRFSEEMDPAPRTWEQRLSAIRRVLLPIYIIPRLSMLSFICRLVRTIDDIPGRPCLRLKGLESTFQQ